MVVGGALEEERASEARGKRKKGYAVERSEMIVV